MHIFFFLPNSAVVSSVNEQVGSSMDAMPPELPSDLAVEVLLRLPVKALVRFKSVCKWWRSLIESPAFISRHLNRPAHRGDGKNGSGGRSLIVEYRLSAAQGDRMALLSGQTLELNAPVEIPADLHWRTWRIVGSCNGVVCLCCRAEYLLWNPATREYRVLPECLVSQEFYGPFYDGFGYDPAVDDYKIVRVCWGYRASKVCLVFALSEGSWREIPSFGCRVCSLEGVFVGGVLYWGAGSDVRVLGDHRILSFDLRDEVFRQVRYPDRGLIGNKKHHRLASSEESLCLIVNYYTVTVLELWVMNGGPGKGSWTKRLSIGSVSGIRRPLGCGPNGGILVEKSDGTLAIYEAGKERVLDLPVEGVPFSLHCRFYMESLVRVIR